MQLSAKSWQPRSNARTVITGALKVRPYTVRKGDTLDLIAEKRGKHEAGYIYHRLGFFSLDLLPVVIISRSRCSDPAPFVSLLHCIINSVLLKLYATSVWVIYLFITKHNSVSQEGGACELHALLTSMRDTEQV